MKAWSEDVSSHLNELTVISKKSEKLAPKTLVLDKGLAPPTGVQTINFLFAFLHGNSKEINQEGFDLTVVHFKKNGCGTVEESP